MPPLTGQDIWHDLVDEMVDRHVEENFVSDDPVVELLERAANLISEAVVDVQQKIRMRRSG